MKIKSLINNENSTINKLSKELNIEQKTLSNYANGKTPKVINLLIDIANYFNVSLDYLCDRQFNQQIGYLTPKQKEIAILISELTDNQCDQVKAIMETLKITIPKEDINAIKNYKGE